MCKRVNANPDDIDFSEEQWFWKYEWTKEEQQIYKEWFMDYLLKDKKRLEQVSRFPRISRNKKELEKLANEFLLQYGWREKQ